MKSKNILVWFRNDLRLHDNEMLVEAIAKSDRILPVYCFDPRDFTPSGDEAQKTGIVRAKFLLESLSELRQSFQQFGGNILLIKGTPEEELPQLIEDLEITEVYHHREVATEDTKVSAGVEDNLWKYKVNLRHFIGHTLYNKEDLPFPIKDIPDVFSQFKKKSERDAIVKPCILTPTEINFVEAAYWGDLPSLAELGFSDVEDGKGSTRGGENQGLRHLQSLLTNGSEIYQKVTSKASIDTRFSSKLSSWLSIGCLSPRKVYWMIKEAEASQGSNPNFNQVLLGLLWRDYFRFMFKKHGSEFCNVPALEARPVKMEAASNDLFEQWKKGTTGHALVDRYMLQLDETGFIPHDARLLVATFLIYSLKIDWTLGAAYFEEKLIDYASASNWGNWAIVAHSAESKQRKSAFDLDKYLRILDSETAVSKSLA
jgi:deoxyribodipyrimidine photo-lyase